MRFSIVLFVFVLSSSKSVVNGQSLMRLSDEFRASENYYPPIKDPKEISDPKRATIMSAIVPGLGQIYNEKYWKVGVLYTLGFGMGYVMKYNLDSMRTFQKALNARIDGDSATMDRWYPLLSDDKVQSERDYYRGNRDMLIIGFIGLYAIQIIDANVDAHLKEFDINPDLALKIEPDVRMYGLNQYSPGITMRLRFK